MTWKPGQSGNPLGHSHTRARVKLSSKFMRSVAAAWRERGDQALIDCAEKQPAAFCQLVASLMPREMQVNVNIDFSQRFLAAIAAANNAVAPLALVSPVIDAVAIEAEDAQVIDNARVQRTGDIP